MSFQGLASAMLVLIIVGAILGCLMYVEINRHVSKAETATPIASHAASTGLPLKSTRVEASASIGLPSSVEDPGEWGEDLTYREEELKQDIAKFETRRQKIEQQLVERREGLEQDRAAFEAWKREAEARIEVESERLEGRQQHVDRLLNWAVLALCAAGAATIGNVTIAVARGWLQHRESSESIIGQHVRRRRSWSKSREPRAEAHGQADEGYGDQGDPHGDDSGLVLWAELMGQRQDVLKG